MDVGTSWLDRPKLLNYPKLRLAVYYYGTLVIVPTIVVLETAILCLYRSFKRWPIMTSIVLALGLAQVVPARKPTPIHEQVENSSVLQEEVISLPEASLGASRIQPTQPLTTSSSEAASLGWVRVPFFPHAS